MDNEEQTEMTHESEFIIDLFKCSHHKLDSILKAGLWLQ